jgi:hypothetical protein
VKKRIALLVAAVAAIVGIFGVGPARADFHGTCTPGSGPTAYARMQLSGPTLTYTGEVKCVGKLVTIDSLVLMVVDGNGRTTAPPVAPSCAGCANPVATGQYTVTGPGQYALSMAFTVQGVGSHARTERAVSTGPGGVLVPLCGGSDGANQQLSCPIPELNH